MLPSLVLVPVSNLSTSETKAGGWQVQDQYGHLSKPRSPEEVCNKMCHCALITMIQLNNYDINKGISTKHCFTLLTLTASYHDSCQVGINTIAIPFYRRENGSLEIESGRVTHSVC